MSDAHGDAAQGRQALFVAAGAVAVLGSMATAVAKEVLAVASNAVARAPEPLGAAVDALAQRGRDEVQAAATRAEQLAERFAHEFARHPAFIGVITEVIDRVLPDAIDTALPAVLDRLVEEPEGVREVVRAQSSGIAEELLTQVRTAAGAGDAALDRTVGRWRLRGDQPVRTRGELAFGP